MRSTLKHDPLVVAALIERGWRYLGVDYSGERANDLIRRLEHLGEDFGIVDITSWLCDLAHSDWSLKQIEDLTPAYTVGETYFGRDPGTFSWLRDEFFPKIISERRSENKLVIKCWSAGCCTGEEVYGLIFLLGSLLGEEFSRWDIQVVGTDVNKKFLERAQKGLYGASALRVSGSDFKDKFFDKAGRHWAVKKYWMHRVRFSYLNLAATPFDSSLDSCDVILCRNVLMYLLPPIAKNVINCLYHRLASSGVLLIGAVDASLATDVGFKGVWTEDNFAIGPGVAALMQSSVSLDLISQGQPANICCDDSFSDCGRLPTASDFLLVPIFPSDLGVVGRSSPSVDFLKRCEELYANKHYQELLVAGKDSLEEHSLTAFDKAKILVLLARTSANLNFYDDALAYSNEALTLWKECVEAMVLFSQLSLQRGDVANALVLIRKAVYLAPDSPFVSFVYSNVLFHSNNKMLAKKIIARTEKLLSKFDVSERLDYGDGLTAGRLHSLAKQLYKVV